MSIMKNKLLKYSQPFQSESLISFINRLGTDNRINLHTILDYFGYSYTDYKNLHNINFNGYEDGIIHYINIATTSNCSLDDIYKTTVENIINCFYDEEHHMLEDIMYVKDKKFTYYCPLCLKNKVYHKVHWHFIGFAICEEHGIKLLSSCTECNNKVLINNVINNKCSNCGHQLSEYKTSSKIYKLDYYNYFIKRLSSTSFLNRRKVVPIELKKYCFCIKFVRSNMNVINEVLRDNSIFRRNIEEENHSIFFLELVELLLKNDGLLIFEIIIHIISNLKLNKEKMHLVYGDTVLVDNLDNIKNELFDFLNINYNDLKGFGIINDERLNIYNNNIELSNQKIQRQISKTVYKLDTYGLERIEGKCYDKSVIFKYKVIEPLLLNNKRGSISARAREVNRIINTANENTIKKIFGSNYYQNISSRTVSRWLNIYINSNGDVNSLFPKYENSGGKGKTRFNEKIKELVNEIIANNDENINYTEIYKELIKRVNNYRLTHDEELKIPSMQTIYNYIKRTFVENQIE